MSNARSRSMLPLPLLAVAVLVLVAVGFYARSAQRGERARLEAATGAIALSVEAPQVTLIDRAERPTALASYRGRVVFVNFWATWCGPCIAELPSLIALQRSLDPADIAFVSIAEDDSWPPVDGFLQQHPLPFELFRDRPPRVEEHFEVSAYPASFLIDREGWARYRFNGGRDWDTPEVRALLALEGVRTAAQP